MTRSKLRRIGFTLGVLLALAVWTVALTAAIDLGRTPRHAVNVGLMGRPAADSLEAWWGRDSALGVERAFCVTNYDVGLYKDPMVADTLFLVNMVERANTLKADRNHVAFNCGNAPTVHTHPMIDGVCNGSPSRLDIRAAWGKSFGVTQCNRNGFEFYYPDPAERW